jgi:peptidoglycan/LPS O-acetylase OafA/YrhL
MTGRRPAGTTARDVGSGLGVWVVATAAVVAVGNAVIPTAGNAWRWGLAATVAAGTYGLGAGLARWAARRHPADTRAGERLVRAVAVVGLVADGVLILLPGGYPGIDGERAGPLAATLLVAYGALLVGGRGGRLGPADVRPAGVG